MNLAVASFSDNGDLRTIHFLGGGMMSEALGDHNRNALCAGANDTLYMGEVQLSAKLLNLTVD